ncbi:hypothetical protein FOPE_01072 [Fonsecaea pedrosoi]|nr:hypothetical protein FOPE_01072 [Fonsecaea pedrosoi]
MTGDRVDQDTEQDTLQGNPSSTRYLVPGCRKLSLQLNSDLAESTATTDDTLNAQNSGRTLQGSVSSHSSPSTASTRQCSLGHGCVLEPPQDLKPAIRTDIAFGDGQGTVGYISEFGELIQVRRMLDFGPRGVIYVRPNSDIFEFAHIIQGSCPGIGLRLNNRSVLPEKDFRPVSYIHDRWPKLSYTAEDIEVEMVFAVVDGKVVHQCVLSNRGSVEATVDLVFDLSFTLDNPRDFYQDSQYRSPTEFQGGISVSGNTCIVLCGNAGGYANFSASLYTDHGHPVTLLPVTSKDLFESCSEPTRLGVGKEDERTNAIYHLLPTKVAPSGKRELTAVYDFNYERWTRDQVYDLKIMRPLSDDFYASQRRHEESFLTAYDNAKANDDSEQANKLLREGVPGYHVAPAREDLQQGTLEDLVMGANRPKDQQSLSPEGEARVMFQVPFHNLGGDPVYSHRLFGIEWRSCWWFEDHVPRTDDFSDILWGNAGEAYEQEMKTLVADKFKLLRADPKTRRACGYVDAHEYLGHNCPGRWIQDLPDQRTNFLFRRYLQHILTVVPIGIPGKRDGDCAYFFCTEDLRDVSMLPSATLYQFRFLGCMHRLLVSQEGIIDDSLKASLLSSIERICKGHLAWCFEVAQKTESGLWTDTYSASGAKKLPEDDHLHTVTNFLKLFDFYVEFPMGRYFVLATLKNRLLPWLKALHETRNKNSGLWESGRETVQVSWWDPSYREDEQVSIPEYDLCESIQYWQALHTVFSILNEVQTENTDSQTCGDVAMWTALRSITKELIDSLESTGLAKELAPSALREKILECFSFEIERFSVETTIQSVEFKNHTPISGSLVEEVKHNKKRLLAIKRCAKERPRWNWYTESMILCPKFDLGFFDTDRPPYRLDEWSNAVEAQQFQLEAFWRKPLRYSLALILASDSKISLDKSKDPAAMASTCITVLLGCVLRSGLMAEEIDPKDKKPQRRYGHLPNAGFGVPYYLFRVTYGNLIAFYPKQISTLSDSSRDGVTFDERLWKKAYKAIRSKTKAGLYNITSVDRANVVDLTEVCEPEWLFDPPWYFAKQERLADRSGGDYGIPDDLKETVRSGLDNLRDLNHGEDNFPYAVFNEAIDLYDRDSDEFFRDADNERLGSVVDVIRAGKRQSRIQEFIPNAWELLERTSRTRTKNDVKKRLIYVYECGPRFSLATHKSINSWITELHIGFYRVISDWSAPTDDDDSDDEQDPRSQSIFSGKPFRLPGDETNCIEKCAISFRFDGDLYDRYWTCYAAVYLPECDTEDRWFADVNSFNLMRPTGEGNRDTEHSQRKILEARWFERATRIRNGRYTATAYDTFRETFETNKTTYFRYGETVKFLRHVLENLEAVRNVADKWENRANAREVQPRWTRDDEAAYALEISIWRRRAKANVQNMAVLKNQVEAKLNHIKQLREWLIDDLQLKEARVSNRSADDVRIFTYATVVFLPLSFASSIFSMGGAPSHSTAVSFVTAAIIALIATLAFVLNAGTFMREIAKWKMWVFDLPDEAGFTEHSESQWRKVGQKCKYWFVRYPSGRVLVAWRVVGMKDRRNIAGKLLLGILLLPLFAFTWIFGFVALNLYDLIKLMFLDLPQYPRNRKKHQDQLKTAKSDEQLSATQKATKGKEKGGKLLVDASNKKEAQRRAAEKAREKWRHERLKNFMHKPRLKDISKHLTEGMTVEEVRDAHRQDVQKRAMELEERRQKYRHAIENVSNFSDTEDEDEKATQSHRRNKRLAPIFWRRRQELDVEAVGHGD